LDNDFSFASMQTILLFLNFVYKKKKVTSRINIINMLKEIVVILLCEKNLEKQS
jgi:hypothetical protein